MMIQTSTTNLKDARDAVTRALVREVATSSRSYREVADRLGVTERRAKQLCHKHGPGLVELIELEEVVADFDSFSATSSGSFAPSRQVA